MRKTLVLSGFVLFLLSAGAATNEVAAATGGVWTKCVEFVQSCFPEVRGNLIWDVFKWVLLWGWWLIIAVSALCVLVFSFFSQKLHVAWFLHGLCFNPLKLLRHSLFQSESDFGKVIDVPQVRKAYRKISRRGFDRIVRIINRETGVSLVMGPAYAGKGTLICAEQNAAYIISIPSRKWYDSDRLVADILRERVPLLANWLLPMQRKRICLILEWDEGKPPYETEVGKLLHELKSLLNSGKAFLKVSVVVKISAYYSIDGEPDQLNLCHHATTKIGTLNLLEPTECLDLLNKELKHRGAAVCIGTIEKWARGAGLAIDRFIWLETLGMPSQVVRVASKVQYESPESWKKIRNWWRQAFKNVRTSKLWMAYLYIIGLKGLIDGDKVDIEKVFQGSQLNYIDDVLPALESIAKRSDQEFDLVVFDPMLIFLDPYVREKFIISMGRMPWPSEKRVDEVSIGESNEDDGAIFSFGAELKVALLHSFNLHEQSVCMNVADAYFRSIRNEPNLVKQIKSLYEFPRRLRFVLKNEGKLILAYEKILEDDVWFEEYVVNVAGRLGVMSTDQCGEMLSKISECLKSNLGEADYVRRMFSLLPVYVMSRRFPDVWGIDFDTVYRILQKTDADVETRFCCAAMVIVAMVSYHYSAVADESRERRTFYDALETNFAYVGSLTSGPRILPKMYSSARRLADDQKCAEFRMPDVDLESLNAVHRTAILAMVSRRADRLLNECSAELWERLHHAKLEGCDELLRLSFRSQMVLNDEVGWGARVRELKTAVDRWAICPMIAFENYESLCLIWCQLLDSAEVDHLEEDELRWLLEVLKRWRGCISDNDFSAVVRWFSELLDAASRHVEDFHAAAREALVEVAIEFVGVAVSFWEPRLHELALDDGSMRIDFFNFINRASYLGFASGVEKEIFKLITPGLGLPKVLVAHVYVDCMDAARLIQSCCDDIFPPPQKYLWVAQILRGKPLDQGCKGDLRQVKQARALLNIGPDIGGDKGLIEAMESACEEYLRGK